MATPKERLADSLEALHTLQQRGVLAIRSRDLRRIDRERLVKAGFMKEVIKGWYVPCRPDEAPGDSSAWYASFWDFCAAYLSERFGKKWCLSPEQSLSLHAGNRAVPTQLLVRAPRGGNKPTALPFGTSLFDVRNAMPDPGEVVERDGLRLFSVPAALVAVSQHFFRRASTDVRAAMATVKDASEVLALLLGGGHSTVAGRLAGAFRNAGQTRIADDIVSTMEKAGYTVRETDPFEDEPGVILAAREVSPYANRLRLMWGAMRQPVLDAFPAPPGIPRDPSAYLKAVDGVYVNDAYHSLSIEGYRVSRELIERVRSGAWNPEANADDRENRNALAARGYYDAFVSVTGSLEKVLRGGNAGSVSHDDHGKWHRELFGPSVTAGIINAADLAGYRTGPVYIRRSMHVPPPREAVLDCMPVLFELLQAETEPAVRVVLGHFIFVYIHPYIDGNGRMGRFLMNVMLASGGYPWTIIPLERRDEYMAALESASVRQDIRPFAAFAAGLVAAGLGGQAAPAVPPARAKS
ncbi:MAG TPA: Fic family protein [Vicinamibacterales bacterium]|nr:Fic family protein [Vicinamibacterales bacterium]